MAGFGNVNPYDLLWPGAPGAGGVLAACCNEAKQRKDIDVVICDTAGRLHTAYGLMEELGKCRTAIKNVLPKQPNEVLLVLDGTTGMCV